MYIHLILLPFDCYSREDVSRSLKCLRLMVKFVAQIDFRTKCFISTRVVPGYYISFILIIILVRCKDMCTII